MDLPDRIGRFKTVSHLGSGSFATVWLVRDEDLDAQVAIKVLAENWSHNEDVSRRFLQEARLLDRLESDRMVRVREVGRLPDGRPYMVMDHADRGTLEDRMRARAESSSPFSVEEALGLSVEIAECLIHAHGLKVLHRDLKPSNVLFKSVPEHLQHEIVRQGRPAPRERLLLSDFGIARRLEGTLAGTVVAGTPHYMAPEQADPLSAALADLRCDIYSAAVVLYELLAGRVPFPHDSVGELLRAQREEEPPPIRTLRTDVPDELARVIASGLAPDPDQRVASAWEWRDALQEAGGARRAPPDGAERSDATVLRRRPRPPAPGAPEAPGSEGAMAPETIARIRPEDAPERDTDQGAAAAATMHRGSARAPQEEDRADADPTSFHPSGQGPERTPAALARPPQPGPAPSDPAVSPETPSRRRGVASRWWLAVAGVAALSVAGFAIASSLRDPAESPPRERAKTPAPGAQAAGSPPATIAFISNPAGSPEIHVLDRAGAQRSSTRTLTDAAGETLRPDWSPDGRKITFASDADGDLDVYVMRADGTGLENLTNNTFDELAPDWSPSGDEIAFTSDRDGDPEVFVMSSQGRGVRQVTDNTSKEVAPDWSPDGEQLTFSSDRDGGFDIYVGSAAGDEGRLVVGRPGSDLAPEWSPSGEEIAFESGLGNVADIFVVDPIAGAVRKVTRGSIANREPAWSEDGETIFFASDRDGDFDIYSVGADGKGKVTNLTNNDVEDTDPAVRPSSP
ncbi:MAG: protein kinase [Actinomycetota bacterium]